MQVRLNDQICHPLVPGKRTASIGCRSLDFFDPVIQVFLKGKRNIAGLLQHGKKILVGIHGFLITFFGFFF